MSNIEWMVVEPGVIRLPTTSLEIHMDPDLSKLHRFSVVWQSQVVTKSATLDMAKLEAKRWFADMLSMGFDS
jgi:hypothetical protein